MSLAELSIKRPVFITAVTILILITGLIGLLKMPINLFPKVEFPVIAIITNYPGASPKEIESQITKKIEKKLATLSNLKDLTSTSSQGQSQVVARFNLDIDIKDARQKVSDELTNIKNSLPENAEDPYIWVMDPNSKPVIILSLSGDYDTNKLYNIADDEIKNQLEQIDQVGLVRLYGGRKHQIAVNLSREKLKEYNISADQIVKQLKLNGQNIPVGKYIKNNKDILVRTIGEYSNIETLENTLINFTGSDVAILLKDVATVGKELKEEKSIHYLNKKKSVFIFVYKQSGANTIAVTEHIKNKITNINKQLKKHNQNLKLDIIINDGKIIKDNVKDVRETIILGIILTIIVVFLFLGNLRSTVITGLALPTSLLGAFALMNYFDFSINVMTLLALSLAVGLLIDDAIVVRENIFRHIQNGINTTTAALNGTKEVTLAVIGTTLTIIAVFGPVAFLHGIVGQFFKEFGLTICFAMLISLFDALTIAPMLSKYFAGKVKSKQEILSDKHNQSKFKKIIYSVVTLQDYLEKKYVYILKYCLKHPILILLISIIIFILSIYSASFVNKTFMSEQNNGEFNINYELPPGTDLQSTNKLSLDIIDLLLTIPEIKLVVTNVGENNVSYKSSTYVKLVSNNKRNKTTSEVKDLVREKLKKFEYAKPVISNYDMVGSGMRPFNLNISGNNNDILDKAANKVFAYLKNHSALSDVEISTNNGEPELQIKLDQNKAEQLGISSILLGKELRTQIDGSVAAEYKKKSGGDLDILVQINPEEKNLIKNFDKIYIPNINNNFIKLSSFATLKETTGPVNIKRENRIKYIQISADMNPQGPGMAAVMDDIKKYFAQELKDYPNINYKFMGESESFNELIENMIIALILALIFIYLVLASLYESYILPITIMLVIPLAIIGALFALLITNHNLDLFSMIGIILLLGLATKNSILLVDYTNQKLQQGYDRSEAIIQAGVTRLRPILMTTVALIAGMLPVAIGINEASGQRTSMGIAIIGGLISSTLLSLLVIPATFSYIDKMRVWGRNKLGLAPINKHVS